MKGQPFSEDFQKSVVSKFLNRGSRTAASIADDVGVSLPSIYGWIKKYGNVQTMTNKPGRKPKVRNSQEKLQLVIKYFSLSEVEKGKFLRENSLDSDHLEQWKRMLESGFDPKPKSSSLAEAAALLILQKKANHLWGTDDDG